MWPCKTVNEKIKKNDEFDADERKGNQVHLCTWQQHEILF